MYCQTCGQLIPSGRRTCPQCPNRGISRRKILIIVGSFTIAVAAAVVIAVALKQSATATEFRDSIQRALVQDAVGMEPVLAIESKSGNVTFAEFFEACDNSISRRTDIRVEVRQADIAKTNAVSMALLAFFEAEDELVRKKAEYYRKALAFSSANDLLQSHIDGCTDLSSYYWNRKRELQEGLLKAQTEVLVAGSEYADLYRSTVAAEGRLASQLSNTGFSFELLLSKYAAANEGLGVGM